MYQVPTTHGASGSPVFNNKGKLIAANFSGYSAQGFNFECYKTCKRFDKINGKKRNKHI